MRYHFSFRDGDQFIADPIGGDFESLAAAVEDGRQAAREMMSLDHGPPDPTYLGGTFEVTDEAGVIQATVSFEESQLQPPPGAADS